MPARSASERSAGGWTATRVVLTSHRRCAAQVRIRNSRSVSRSTGFSLVLQAGQGPHVDLSGNTGTVPSGQVVTVDTGRASHRCPPGKLTYSFDIAHSF